MKRIFRFFLNRVPRPWLIQVSYLLRPLFGLYYKGSTYTDPIDGRSFRSFLPYGYEHPRDNVLSPTTLSLERHRLLWLYLKNETNFFSAKNKVLHFAPEQAFYKRFKKLENIDYVTTDLNSPLADVKADICQLPFADESFDVILCNHVLEHIPDDTKAMSELYRVLKKGGWGIFQIPQDTQRSETFEDNSITDKKERAAIFGQYDHVRIYGMDYFDKLRNAGFTVEPIDYTANYSSNEVERYRLAQGELIPLVRK
jgi:SAM-dependent methyltransferase